MTNAQSHPDPIEAHRRLGGKIAVQAKAELTAEALAALYTPGVGQASSYLAEHPEAARELTIKRNSLAVISDGSAVLGLGNIGPYGALPVMEGKAMLFKQLADIDAWPLVLDTQDTEGIIAAVKAVAPVFGAINLEDIAAPACYEIEERLQEALDIPVMHDDQHATAIIALAGLINAFKVVGKDLRAARVVIVGAGAAGSALLRLLLDYGLSDVVLTDSRGIVEPSRTNLDPYKQQWARLGNPRHLTGDAGVALRGADAVVAVSVPGAVTAAQVKTMAKDPVVFALANPTPEIMPEDAKAAGAAVIATGRSDFPNQINNVLVFPGIFRGMLDSGVREVTPAIKLRAAQALAGLVPHPTAGRIVPSALDREVALAVAAAVQEVTGAKA
ncbi:MAG: malate dehydrogenase Mdh [Patescibacteria group bacterium]|nr:malate dehydrogenase Mdh [Patescibacteria group bacterium]